MIRTHGTMPAGVIEEILPDEDPVERFRFWLRLMARYDRALISRVIVIRECLADPTDDLVFVASGELLRS